MASLQGRRKDWLSSSELSYVSSEQPFGKAKIKACKATSAVALLIIRCVFVYFVISDVRRFRNTARNTNPQLKETTIFIIEPSQTTFLFVILLKTYILIRGLISAAQLK